VSQAGDVRSGLRRSAEATLAADSLDRVESGDRGEDLTATEEQAAMALSRVEVGNPALL